MPMYVIAEMLGVSSDDYGDFRRWSDAMIEAGGGDIGAKTTATVVELLQYVLRIAEQRRHEPQDDLISIIAEAEVDGERLTDAEIGMFCLTLLVAGNETTRNLVRAAGSSDAQSRAAREAARRSGALPNAIEEMLRVVSPVLNFARVATEDTELRGKQIRAGDSSCSSTARRTATRRCSAPIRGVRRHARERTAPDRVRLRRAPVPGRLARAARSARDVRGAVRALAALRARRGTQPLPSSLMNGLVRMPVVLEP